MKGKLYLIKNDLNQKVYVGKTYASLSERFNEHIKDSKREKNANRHLYRAFNKYGIEHFKIVEIGTFEETTLEEKEIQFIKAFDSYENGYNMTLGGDGARYFSYSDSEVIEKYKELKYVSYVAKELNADASTIRKILKTNGIDTSAPISKKSKAIGMYKDGEEIQSFTAIVEAARWLIENNYTTTSEKHVVKGISRAINGSGDYMKYQWLKH